jgi:hypothetical protein
MFKYGPFSSYKVLELIWQCKTVEDLAQLELEVDPVTFETETRLRATFDAMLNKLIGNSPSDNG